MRYYSTSELAPCWKKQKKKTVLANQRQHSDDGISYEVIVHMHSGNNGV